MTARNRDVRTNAVVDGPPEARLFPIDLRARKFRLWISAPLTQPDQTENLRVLLSATVEPGR
jgi:hypothetical protein